ncbi:UDP-N-acetylmuramate dehydrogenase [Candidatus Parcubacteria bacterium]|nr:UDP-N-acetylmuramate dehydrogenase [Candidatus Parcubacteria bacterium]
MLKKIKKNYPLADLTTFKIGGPAEYFIKISAKEELKEAFAWAKEKNIQVSILGGGSNLLISDQGVKGLVVLVKNEKLSVHGERMAVGAGASLAKVLSHAISCNLSGLEWSNGIPRATMGGAIRGNAEAFGCSISDIVETVEVFDVKKNKFEVLSRSMCFFGYRKSVFSANKNLIICEAVLKMLRKNKKQIEELVERSLEFRLDKYPNLPSAGSVFKNLDPEEIKKKNSLFFDREIKNKIGRQGLVGAGLIIDFLGLKGKTIGGAKVSLEHANHIVNTGKATADEVAQLISLIKTQARNKFRINLREEIQYLGF